MTGLSLVVVVLLIGALIYRVGIDSLGQRLPFFRYYERLGAATRIGYGVASFMSVLAVWSFLSYGGFVRPYVLPTPSATIASLWFSIGSGELLFNTAVSVARVVAGFGLAAIVGVSFGSIAGAFPRPASMILPVNSAFRYIPPTAFIGLTIIWFGIDEVSKIALIVLAIIFYVTQMVADVVRLVPRTYIEAAQSLGATRRELFVRVSLAMSKPDILAVLRVNLGAAWTFVIVAEIVAGQRGLGYLMAVSQRFLDTPKLFAMLITVGLLGSTTDALMATLIRRSAPWR